MWIVRFELVSPVDHPEYFEDGKPSVERDDVLSEDWKAVAVTHREHTDAIGQFRGLKELARQHELIRNIKLRRVVDVLVSEVVDAELYRPDRLNDSGREDLEGQEEEQRCGASEDHPDPEQHDLADPGRQ